MQILSTPSGDTQTINGQIMSARKVIEDVLLEPVGNMVGPGIHSVQVRKCKTHLHCWTCLGHYEVNLVFMTLMSVFY